MTLVTKAHLQAEVEALRHNADLLEAEIARLRAKIAALEAPAPVRAATARSVTVAGGVRRVFTFDPAIPGDFVRASKLAREHHGSVQRQR